MRMQDEALEGAVQFPAVHLTAGTINGSDSILIR